MRDFMKEFLAQGYVVYLMGALCALGILCELTAGHIYRRLNKQAERIVYAKHPFFKRLRMEYEKAAQIGAGVMDGQVFTRKKLFSYRVCGIHLSSFARAAIPAGVACLLAAAADLLGCLWFGFSAREMMYPAAGGAVAALGLALFHLLANEKGKERYLELQVQDYLMNAAAWRNQAGREVQKEDKKPNTGLHSEAAPGREEGQAAVPGENFSGKNSRARAREIAELKKSLEQIAAAREKNLAGEANGAFSAGQAGSGKTGENKGLLLTSDQEGLIQEILQDYFA